MVLCDRPDGSRILASQNSADGGDARLVAELGPEEPESNALDIVCSYVKDGAPHCPLLTLEDLDPPVASAGIVIEIAPADLDGMINDPPADPSWDATIEVRVPELEGTIGEVIVRPELRRVWRILAIEAPRGGREARWTESSLIGEAWEPPRPVSVKQVMGSLGDYEPVAKLTVIAWGAATPGVSVVRLRDEYMRVATSQRVLVRRLREAVRDSPLSLTEIARRCKHMQVRHGGGDRVWLERIVGLKARPGTKRHSTWIHVSALQTIARDGLGLSLDQVEVPGRPPPL